MQNVKFKPVASDTPVVNLGVFGNRKKKPEVEQTSNIGKLSFKVDKSKTEGEYKQ